MLFSLFCLQNCSALTGINPQLLLHYFMFMLMAITTTPGLSVRKAEHCDVKGRRGREQWKWNRLIQPTGKLLSMFIRCVFQAALNAHIVGAR